MTLRKNLPSTAEAVAFINACAGEELVRAHNRTASASYYIDFEIPATKFINQPLNYALTRFWRVLGTQTRTARSMFYKSIYQWDFSPTRRLQLLYLLDGKTIVRLYDEELL